MTRLMIFGLVLFLSGCIKKEPPAPTQEYLVKDQTVIIEGDIAISQFRKEGAYSALKYADTTYKYFSWPKGIVPYVIKKDVADQKRITDAINIYHQKTKIRFVPRTTQSDYIEIGSGSGCWSWIGRVRGAQKLSLAPAPNCTTGTVIHELGHALGLWHEHMRWDRDKYVTIHLENVVSGQEYNFKQNKNMTKDFSTYDFDSIMHYPYWTFSKNDQPTITKKDGSTSGFGQSDHLSAGDIAAIHFINGL